MLHKILSTGITPDLKKPVKFKIRIINGLAIGSLFIVLAYGLIHSISGDNYASLMPLISYAITGFSILIFNYYKKYITADYVLNILFPISFIISSIQLGGQLNVEYYLYLTGIGVLFFNSSISPKKQRIFFIINVFLFIILKIYIIYKPNGFVVINQNINPYFNIFSGVVIFILLYVIMSIIFNNNINLVKRLKNLNKEVQNNAEDLKRYIYELERFSYISAHDLREPLRTIKGFSYLLKREIKNGKTENIIEYLTFIESGINRLDSLTEDIVKYTEIESLIPKVESVDTEIIIHDIIKDKNIDCHSENLPLIKMNAHLCYFLFENIINNAIEHCDKPTLEIRIKAHSSKKNYHFSITDNGKGIEEEYHKLVFEMFKRLENDVEKQGSGIGLAICKKIVEGYKGKIWIESEIEVGTTVHFLLPKT